MRKTLSAIFVFLIMFLFCNVPVFSENAAGRTEKAMTSSRELAADTEEEIFRTIFITLIYPHVQNAIGDYYKEYMTYLPGEDPWSYKHVSIERALNQNFSYTIKIEVQPYVGPHLSVGIDQITLKVDLYGVEVLEYEHLKSYELPPHYKNIIIKGLPK